jgi:hypothetical protein
MKTPKLEMRPVKDLIPYELNSKKHEKDQVKKIVESIKRFGWDVPIVVDKHGIIIKGHGRRLAAIELGLDKVPVLVRDDLSDDQVKAARVADNRVAISDIDPEMLKAELAAIDMDLTGIFDAKELEFLDADLGAINPGAFVDDMDKVVAEQRADIETRIETAAASKVSLARAFGFKDISAAGQIAITNLMAKAEAATGLKNDEALVAFAATL